MLHFFLILVVLMFFGCHPQKPLAVVYTGTIMTIDYKIIIGHSLQEAEKHSIETVIFNTFHEINTIYNKWNPDSELSALNQLKKGEIQAISPQLENFLNLTDEIVRLSEGRFDPTIEPLQQLWKRHFALGTTPQQEEIEHILPAVGWDKIHFSKGYFYKDHDLTSLDLGGIAKGYCVDLLIERLNAKGYLNVFVEWGGEIRASGEHPDKRPWNVFISRFGDPNPANAIDFLSLSNQAIATSGDYLQQWKIADKVYFHIIDPQTHRPLISTSHSIASASVLASTCMLADGLSTTFMVFSNEKEAKKWGEKIKQKIPEVKFWILSQDF